MTVGKEDAITLNANALFLGVLLWEERTEAESDSDGLLTHLETTIIIAKM